jgi:hypothetical protein
MKRRDPRFLPPLPGDTPKDQEPVPIVGLISNEEKAGRPRAPQVKFIVPFGSAFEVAELHTVAPPDRPPTHQELLYLVRKLEYEIGSLKTLLELAVKHEGEQKAG